MADKKEEKKEEEKEVKKEKKEEKKEVKKEKKKEAKEKKKEEKKEIEVSPKLKKLIEEVEKLTVLELADLVSALEEKFGVSASVAALPATAPEGNGNGEKEAPEQTVFNVVLKSAGGSKIQVIKAIRELVPTLGLKDAKDLVDQAPKEVLTQVDKTKAEEAKKKLEEAGAEVELK